MLVSKKKLSVICLTIFGSRNLGRGSTPGHDSQRSGHTRFAGCQHGTLFERNHAKRRLVPQNATDVGIEPSKPELLLKSAAQRLGNQHRNFIAGRRAELLKKQRIRSHIPQ